MDLGRAQGDLVADYSHGMRKKIALAASLLPAPRMLFLDEPFEGIDALASRQIKDLLTTFVRGGGTVFLTSHVLEIVERLCDRIGIIRAGRLVAEGPLHELRGSSGSTLEERFIELLGGERAAAPALDWLGVMWRTFGAFAWLRWRLLRNQLRGAQAARHIRADFARPRAGRARDARGPGARLHPAASAASVCSPGGQRRAGPSSRRSSPLSRRALLVLAFILVIGLAVVAPTQSALTRYTRLLLLPIRRQSLHLVEVASTLADPWLAAFAFGLVMLPLGLLVGGGTGAAFVAFVAALPLMALLALAGALTSFLSSWLLRSRRRGEMFTLVFVLALALLSLLPMLLVARPGESREERRARAGHPFSIAAVDRGLPRWVAAAAVRAVRTRARRRHRRRSAHGVDGDPGARRRGWPARMVLLGGARQAARLGREYAEHVLPARPQPHRTLDACRASRRSSRPWRSRRRGPRSDRCAAG